MRLLFGLVIVGLFSASAILAQEEAHQDAHYLVFRMQEDEPRLISAQRVRLASPLESRSAAEIGRVEGDAAVVRLESAAGEVLYRDVVEVPRWIRGEFHGRKVRPGVHEIEGRQVEAADRVFVVRVPVLPAARHLAVEGARRTVFDLRQVAAAASSAPAKPPKQQVINIGPVGKPGNRVDFLILGDGYTAKQRTQFIADARRFGEQFFRLSPYAEYRSFVNVQALFTPSGQAGADHPPYDPLCAPGDAACCADPDAQLSPRAGTFVSTAFDATFCVAGIQRLLAADTAKAMQAAAAVPDWDRLVLIVNDTEYGGSGGLMPVSSIHEDGLDILRHEYGHSFTLLADEYDAPFPGYPACSDRTGPACEANVTDETVRHLIKWSPWIAGSTPLPTSAGSFDLGLFEGARYLSAGMYRSRDVHCLMHFLGVPFDEVCRQEYVRRLYQGPWGQPAAGIDLIEPGSEVPRPGTIASRAGVATRFSVALLKPAHGQIEVSWLVDGAPVAGATGNAFRFVPRAAGTYRVELRVKDRTSFVHPEMAGDLLDTSRVWTVNVRKR